MKKLILLLAFFIMLFASQVFSLPIPGEWHLEDGIAAVLDPEGDGGNRGDVAGGRDSSPMSSPGNAYYWNFDGLIRTKDIPGEFIDNGDGTAWRNIEIYWSDGIYTFHGDNLWEQLTGTVNEVSVDSYFTGKTYYRLINNEWVWESTTDTSQIRGKFSGHPSGFKLTDHVFFDYYGYSDIVGYNIFSGKVTEAVKAIFPIPEPSTMLLFGTGIASLTAVRRRRK